MRMAKRETWDERYDALAVSGTLFRNPEFETNADVPKYVLQLKLIRDCRTPYGLAYRSTKGFC